MKIKDWDILNDFFNIDEQNKLHEFLLDEYANNIVYPPKKDLFRAFYETPYKDVRLVILGQDPYHTPNVADGLAFSTREEKAPPSLVNIDKLVYSTYNKHLRSYNLEFLAKQGVLLFNTALSVKKGKPNSHGTKIWGNFTLAVLEALNQKEKLVYLLWGAYARSFSPIINKNHKIITCSHPSPLSAVGFLNSDCLQKANNALLELDFQEIRWF